MKVVYIAAECKPFSKVGGVGDVAGELPPELKKQGIDIEIITPLYGIINPEFIEKRTDKYTLNFNGKKETVEIHQGNLDGLTVHFIKNKNYFDGATNGKDYSEVYIYSDKIPFYDDALRFSFFSEACLHLINNIKPDIVHINDWGLGYLFGRMAMEKEMMSYKRIMTVHNIGYQGNLEKKIITDWEIGKILTNKKVGPLFIDPRERWRSVNPLKLGLELSDMANTVSPTYSKEITELEDQERYFEGGKGLHGVTQRLYNEGKLIGITNGFHYKNKPTNENFNETLKKKKKMRDALAKDFAEPDNLLLGFVGRAVEQKFKLLTETVCGRSVLEQILDIRGVNVAILGTGLPEYESFMRNISAARFIHPLNYDQFLNIHERDKRQNYSYTIAFNKAKAQQISMGSDIFLMPSLYEPCGITQMESLANATPPLVRWTGGLVDTVIPHTEKEGTGFGFDGSTKEGVLHSLLSTVHEALAMYKNNKKGFQQLQKRGFKERFSWSDSAKKYIDELYLPALKNNSAKKHK